MTQPFFICDPRPRSFDAPERWTQKPANWRERAPGGYSRSSAFPTSGGNVRGLPLTSPKMTTGDKWEPPVFLPPTLPKPERVVRKRTVKAPQPQPTLWAGIAKLSLTELEALERLVACAIDEKLAA